MEHRPPTALATLWWESMSINRLLVILAGACCGFVGAGGQPKVANLVVETLVKETADALGIQASHLSAVVVGDDWFCQLTRCFQTLNIPVVTYYDTFIFPSLDGDRVPGNQHLCTNGGFEWRFLTGDASGPGKIPSSTLLLSLEIGQYFTTNDNDISSYVRRLTEPRPEMIAFSAATPSEGLLRTEVKPYPTELTYTQWISQFHRAGYWFDVLTTIAVRNSLVSASAHNPALLWIAKNILMFQPCPVLPELREVLRNRIQKEYNMFCSLVPQDSLQWFRVPYQPHHMGLAVLLHRDGREYYNLTRSPFNEEEGLCSVETPRSTPTGSRLSGGLDIVATLLAGTKSQSSLHRMLLSDLNSLRVRASAGCQCDVFPHFRCRGGSQLELELMSSVHQRNLQPPHPEALQSWATSFLFIMTNPLFHMDEVQ
jgi:hypothetical protein